MGTAHCMVPTAHCPPPTFLGNLEGALPPHPRPHPAPRTQLLRKYGDTCYTNECRQLPRWRCGEAGLREGAPHIQKMLTLHNHKTATQTHCLCGSSSTPMPSLKKLQRLPLAALLGWYTCSITAGEGSWAPHALLPRLTTAKAAKPFLDSCL